MVAMGVDIVLSGRGIIKVVGTIRVPLYSYPCWRKIEGGITKIGTRSMPTTILDSGQTVFPDCFVCPSLTHPVRKKKCKPKRLSSIQTTILDITLAAAGFLNRLLHPAHCTIYCVDL